MYVYVYVVYVCVYVCVYVYVYVYVYVFVYVYNRGLAIRYSNKVARGWVFKMHSKTQGRQGPWQTATLLNLHIIVVVASQPKTPRSRVTLVAGHDLPICIIQIMNENAIIAKS